ncbi:BPTI/Kunitz domain-containing protein [Pontibacter rugosus]|uniref:BPTI/Kunitz domain-containing protein n=1 Tax=Pontibacter rugosus TaxID=1745966 RepID=A0ABW3SWP2_9BACT
MFERCTLAPDPGPCRAAITRYYYDQKEKRCKSFIWGGCRGVLPFETGLATKKRTKG